MPIKKQAAATAAATAHASLDPETFMEGGRLDDVDVTIKESGWVVWDYNKGAGSPSFPFLQLVLTDATGKDHDQFFKCGDLADFAPTADGEYIDLVSDPNTGVPRKKGLSSQSNAGILLASLVAAGFPKTKLNDSPISVVNGTFCHVHQEAQKRTGKALPGVDPNKEQSVMVVDKIHKLPWEAAAQAAATAPVVAGGIRRAGLKAVAAPAVAVAGPAPATGTDPEALVNYATELLMGIVAAGPVAKKDMPAKLYEAIPQTEPMRGRIIALAYTDDFLSKGPWKYEGGVISL